MMLMVKDFIELNSMRMVKEFIDITSMIRMVKRFIGNVLMLIIRVT